MPVKEPALDFDELYQLALAGQCVYQLENELYQLKRLIKSNYDLKVFLENTFVPVSSKRKLVAEIVPAETTVIFTELINYLLEIGRADWFHRLSDIFSQTVATKTGQAIVEVFSPGPLEENFLEKIRQTIGSRIKTGLIIKNIVNPDLIGGLMFKIGDLIIDASLRQKLYLLEKALA